MSGSVEYVIVDGVAYPKAGTFPAERGTGQESAQICRSDNVPAQKAGRPRGVKHAARDQRSDYAPAYDPHQVHREFPERWQHYIQSNYRSLRHVMNVFRVSERTARKWWNGDTGANGGHVAIAVNEHPVAAQRMLFAAE